MTKMLPTAMMVQSVLAAVIYGFNGDWRQMFYWTFAAGITASVTF